MPLSEDEEFELLSLERQRAKPEPSIGQRLLGAATRGANLGVPGAILNTAREGGNIISEGIDKLAYGGGGMATDIASNLGASPEAAGVIGAAVKTAIPMPLDIATGKVLATAAAPAMKAGARWLMQQAVSPERKVRLSGEAGRAIETMLQKRINPTMGGVEASQGKVGALEGELQSTLENSPALANRGNMLGRIKGVRDSVKDRPNVVKNNAEIDDAIDTFVQHPNFAQGGNIPVRVANDMKQAFYKDVGEAAYVPGAQLSPTMQTNKALAGGMADEIARVEPAAIPTLKEQSDLLNVIKVLKPTASRQGNKMILGLGALSPTMERTAIWMLDRYPWFKGMIAQGAYSGAETIPAALAIGGSAAARKIKNEPPANPQH